MLSDIERVGVVVPAHNEEALLSRTLQSIAMATTNVPLPTMLVVVLDRCSDGSSSVAADAASHFSGLRIRIVEGRFPDVGAARNAGIVEIAAAWPDVPDRLVWTAHTDADTEVPEYWIADQLRFADAGVDLVIGTAEPDEPEQTPAMNLWRARHSLDENHAAVHGANLGIRLNTLLAVGGFVNRALGEDVETVARLREAGAAWVATDTTRVRTSARRRGRVRDGFAGYLRGLDAEIATTESERA